MLRLNLTAAALVGAALLAGCAQTGEIPATVLTVAAEAPAGWRPFSADSPWNTPIGENPKLDPNSDVLAADVGAGGDLYINMAEWSVMVKYFDSSAAPKRSVRALYEGRYGRGFGPDDLVPLPADTLPEGATDAQTHYTTLVDPVRNIAWDTRQLGKSLQGDWFAGFGTKVDLTGTGVSMPWMKAERSDLAAGPRPSGTPLIAGLIRVDEVKAGRIDHALAFAYPMAQTGKFVPPASTALTAASPEGERHIGLPMGARIQLDPAYDIDQTLLSPGAKVVAKALQEYGAILVDEAGATVLYAESGAEQLAAWDGVLAAGDLQMLFTQDFIATHFRVIDTGPALPGIPAKLN
jgi:hypothetical protein